jgi:uncharacterized protein with FMN-binding domain
MHRRNTIAITLMGFLLLGTLPAPRSISALGIKEYQASIDALTIEDPDLTKVPDGSYPGAYETKMVSAQVLVHISSGCIAAIDLVEHKKGKGGPAEAITDTVVARQSLAVDVVSGATASSKVILKAIENAIKDHIE